MLEKSIRSGHSGERVMDTTSAIEMTMSVTGDERTELSATTAAGGVTYWASEFERVYFMKAAAEAHHPLRIDKRRVTQLSDGPSTDCRHTTPRKGDGQ